MRDDDPRHGSVNGYNNLRCRCQPCRDAASASHLEYMNRKPEQREHQRRYMADYYANLRATEEGRERMRAKDRAQYWRRKALQ